jgi:hypothetical protein
VPALTVEAAVTLKTLLPLALNVAGENETVIPAGNALTESATDELDAVSVTVIVNDCEEAACTVNDVALALRVSEGATTTSETVTVCFIAPLVPVIVSADVLATAVELAVKLKTLCVVPLMLVGVNVAVTLLGNPATVSPTAELKPFCPLIDTVTEPELPRCTESVVALAATV